MSEDPSPRARQMRLPGSLRFARMAGSSIAAPSAAPWLTDFLNAAYYARPAAERDVSDLRLAHGILTTRWSQGSGRRLGALDVVALHRAYGTARRRQRGRLDRSALLDGAVRLLGAWFPAAWEDPSRRAYGIAFPGRSERDAFQPERRLRQAALGPLTPPALEPGRQHWSTYDPVALPDAGAALELHHSPWRWPDIGCAGGRFTPLRSQGLPGQTFEIEVVVEPSPRSPIFTRGYVTCTLAEVEPGVGLDHAVTTLVERYRRGAEPGAPPILPEGAEPLALVVLTTHRGHFLGAAKSHLLLWRDAGGAWIRDIGAWDPMPLHVAATYKAAGRTAQKRFLGTCTYGSQHAGSACIEDESGSRSNLIHPPVFGTRVGRRPLVSRRSQASGIALRRNLRVPPKINPKVGAQKLLEGGALERHPCLDRQEHGQPTAATSAKGAQNSTRLVFASLSEQTKRPCK